MEFSSTPPMSIDTPIISAGKILANAAAYVSGRYHPAILASLGGTPCVFMSSNSHKTKSLQGLLEYDFVHEYYVLPSDEEIEEMAKRTRLLIEKGDSLRKTIQDRSYHLSIEAEKMSNILL